MMLLQPVRVAVLTTSYPRHPDDHAGRFVADAVDRLRATGVEVDVVGPGAFPDFGLGAGDGVLANARRRPWLAPPLLASMALAARRAARGADLVHAHWLPPGGAAALAGRPLVVTLHGSDIELARRAPRLARTVLGRARVVIAVSKALAEEGRALGARDVRVIPNGVELPPEIAPEAAPPEILYAGRLAPEKGVEELAAAATGLPLVVAGDGPLRSLFPGALGFVPRPELERLYSRAAVVVCPSRREGFGVTCAEALAHGRPVVAGAVGGLLDLVVEGETGLLVPPRDPAALRAALERLLADPELRRRMGARGREWVARLCSWERVTDLTLAAYRDATAGSRRRS
jgi:glycosyltransferase involved in cell wall biosynthesis